MRLWNKKLTAASMEPWLISNHHYPPSSNLLIYNRMNYCYGSSQVTSFVILWAIVSSQSRIIDWYHENPWLHEQKDKLDFLKHCLLKQSQRCHSNPQTAAWLLNKENYHHSHSFSPHLIFRELMQLETSSKFLRNLHKTESPLSCAE